MSDILRLLARSTSVSKATAPSKPKQPAAPAPVAEVKLTTAARRREQKRRAAANAANAANGTTGSPITLVTASPEADGSQTAGSSKEEKKKSKKRKRDEVEKVDTVATLDSPITLGPGEVRSLLKLHKLKYTILATLGSRKEILKAAQGEEEAESVKSASKKAKTKKKAKEKKKSEGEKQGGEKNGDEPAAIKAPASTKLDQIFPTPIQTFEELRTNYNISKRLYDNVVAQKFSAPTEVQMGSLPLLLDGTRHLVPGLEECDVDLMTIAPTGSGKTLAYAIPAIDHLIRTKHEDGESYEKGIRVIVLSPTRELADQIVNEFRKLLLGTGIKVVGMKKTLIPKERRRTKDVPNEEYGDDNDSESSEEDDSEDDEDGAETTNGTLTRSTKGIAVKSEIMVATPLLLLHAIQLCPDLFPVSKVSRIILDEADVLLDDLFLSQTTSIISHLTSPSLSFSFWSATMPSNSETLATKLISSHPSILSGDKTRKLVRLIAGIKDSSLPTIRQTITYTASERGKLTALRQLFSSSLKTPCLIFLQTIPRAQALHAEIMYDLPTPNRIAVLHSNLSETARSKVMDSFRAGEVWVLITTDLLSRGVDFRGVNLVINYDIPTSVASYIHRVGRTGRAGREGGMAITYYTEEDVKYVRGIVGVMEKSGGAEGLQKWMLNSLPKTTKEEKKELKKKGVKERRAGVGAGESKKSRISTKSGYDRKIEMRRKAAIDVSKQKMIKGNDDGDGDDSGSEWEGFA